MSEIYAQLYQGALKGFRWRAKALGNQRNMANGGEGYKNKVDCQKAMEKVLGLTYDFETRSWTRDGRPFRVDDLT